MIPGYTCLWQKETRTRKQSETDRTAGRGIGYQGQREGYRKATKSTEPFWQENGPRSLQHVQAPMEKSEAGDVLAGVAPLLAAMLLPSNKILQLVKKRIIAIYSG